MNHNLTKALLNEKVKKNDTNNGGTSDFTTSSHETITDDIRKKSNGACVHF